MEVGYLICSMEEAKSPLDILFESVRIPHINLPTVKIQGIVVGEDDTKTFVDKFCNYCILSSCPDLNDVYLVIQILVYCSLCSEMAGPEHYWNFIASFCLYYLHICLFLEHAPQLQVIIISLSHTLTCHPVYNF